MVRIRRKLAAIIMTGFLMVGTTFAKPGILLSDLSIDNKPQTCSRTNSGILMSDFAGIIVTTFTGIIVTTFTGIIVTTASETTAGCVE